MRTKWIFGIIMLFTIVMLSGGGFLLFREESIPFWVMQIMAVIAILFSVFIYKVLIYPWSLLQSAIQLLKEQDFSTTLHPVKNKEANQLIELFNKMTLHLRNERLAVREKNHFLDLLIQASPQGIIILDFDKRITDINPSGIKLLHLTGSMEVKGKKLEDIDIEIASSLALLKQGEDVILRDSGNSFFRCIRSSFIDKGFDHPFILIEELTQELLKVEKRSYERIIRMMSHEVNNSVGAIGSTLSVISEIFSQENRSDWEEVLPAVNASFDRCGHLAHFISNLARVIKIPEPVLAEVSLNEQLRSVEALTHMECRKRHIKLTLLPDQRDCRIHIDAIQIEQVLVNIIKNAYEAIGQNGEIRLITRANPPAIQIMDNGPGIPEDVQAKLFTPFYTTKPTGQGIGLMFVREVLINHHCRFSLVHQDGWTTFRILFQSGE